MRAIKICFLVMLVTLTAAALYAQQGPAPVPRYEPQKEQRFTGVVEQVNNYHCPISGKLGAHLTLQNPSGRAWEVHLAPVQFLKDYEISIEPGAKVEIVGMETMYDGKLAMLARTVTVGQATYTFRDERGRPLW
jgi:hypothetical protein